MITRGTLLDYRLRLHGIPLLWVHEHVFAEQDNGTLVGDKVEYSVFGGRLVQNTWSRQISKGFFNRIFQYRYRVLEELFAADKRAATP